MAIENNLKKLFFLSFFLIPIVFVRADDPAQQIIGPFGTLNNRDNSAAIGDNMAQDLLNVDITPGGKSFKKRRGYGQAFATTVTTSAIHGTYEFYDSAGNDVTLAFNDFYLTSSINGASPTVISSTGPLAATYQCVDSQGFAYCASTARTAIIKTNGVTASNQPVVSTGTMIAVTPDRMVQSGISGAANRIDFSAAADFTSWTTGISATSAFQFTITAPGSSIKHITYAFNRIMWFKDSSFGYILPGATAADWVVKTISPIVGTLDNSSVYWQDVLYFRGQDGHIYSYDGSSLQKISKEISGTISSTQRRTGNSWTQTTAADFGASSTTPSMYLDTTTIPGQIFLATNTVLTAFEDSLASEFAAGSSFVNVDTTTLPGSVALQYSIQPGIRDSCAIGTASDGACNAPYYLFSQTYTPTTNYAVTSITLSLYKEGSPSNYTLSLKSDNAGSPGTTLASASISSSGIGSSYPGTEAAYSLSPVVVVSSGTKYWITMIPTGSCGSGDRILAELNPSECHVSADLYIGAILVAGEELYYKISGSAYLTSGSFISRSFDVGFTTNTWLWSWGTLSSITVVPSSTTITYETQTSSSSTGGFDTLTSVTSGSNPSSPPRQFIRYKATLATTDVSTSPILQELSIAMSARIRPYGTFYSQIKNAANLTNWDSFTADATSTLGFSTHTFYIRSSTNNFTIGSSTPAWTVVTNGAIPSVSTGTFFQIRDDFMTAAYSRQATLFDFTQNWFEGVASDKSYATYFNDSILFAVAYGTAASSNNRILKYDLVNQGWLIYDLPVGGFYLKNLSLYFGSSSAGYIYKYGDTDNDNGAAINAYWKSKDFFGVDPFRNEEIRNLSVYGRSIANSTVTVTMTTNELSISSFTISTYNAGANFFNSNRNFPNGVVSNTFNVNAGNNAADQPFEIFAERIGLAPKPWNPTTQ